MSVGVGPDEMQARLTAEIGEDALAAAWQSGIALSDREARDFALGALARARADLTDGPAADDG